MDMLLAVGGWTLFGSAIIVALVLDLIGLFGNWIILAALVLAWVATGFVHFGWISLSLFLALAILGEVLEFFLAGFGAKKFGGSKGAMTAALIGCLVGGIVGTPWFPLVGTLLGACLGAFVAAGLYEYMQQDKSAGTAAWVGLGAALGKIGGLFAKLFCGLAMLVTAALSY